MAKANVKVCAKCGSKDVEQKIWISCSTKKPVPSSDPIDMEDCWCVPCEEHNNIITQEEYEQQQQTD